MVDFRPFLYQDLDIDCGYLLLVINKPLDGYKQL